MVSAVGMIPLYVWFPYTLQTCITIHSICGHERKMQYISISWKSPEVFESENLLISTG